MTNKPIQGKLSGSEYPFVMISKEELLNADKTIIQDRFTTFMLVSSEYGDEIDNVHVIGTTTSQKALEKHLDHFVISHILFINDHPIVQRHGLSEELILMYSPKEIWFLDKGTKLVYNEWLSKL